MLSDIGKPQPRTSGRTRRGGPCGGGGEVTGLPVSAEVGWQGQTVAGDW